MIFSYMGHKLTLVSCLLLPGCCTYDDDVVVEGDGIDTSDVFVAGEEFM